MEQLPPNVLIVEDDADWLEIYSIQLTSDKYELIKARTVKRAAEHLSQQEFAVVATDLKLLGANTGGFDILEMVRQQTPDTQVIIFTGVGCKEDAFEAMRRGAYDYVTKPLDYEYVKQVIKAAIDVRAQKLSYRRSNVTSPENALPFPGKFVGSSQAIKQVLSQVAKIVTSTQPVLVWGAPGTGKALITETIHRASSRKPFILVNCASYSEATLENSLFGVQKGSSPEATENEVGLLEQASGGTLVLDEVSYLSPRLQKQLFSVLYHQETRRAGSARTSAIDVRVLATSRFDLQTYVAQSLFYEELYEFLSASIIKLPPLKERKDEQTDDVLLLAGYFLDKYSQEDEPLLTISDEAMNLLQNYDFRGNVRELEEAIRIAIARAESNILEPFHLPIDIQNQLHSTKLPQIIRNPLLDEIRCPHGYSMTEKAESIADTFDTSGYIYLSVGDTKPNWYQSTLEDVIAHHGLKLYRNANLPVDEDVCPICYPILSSHQAILDISSLNPLVFYELGLAQATGLHCLVLKEKGKARLAETFNISFLEYEDEVSLRRIIYDWLNKLENE